MSLRHDRSVALCATCLAWLSHRMDHAQDAVGGWRVFGHEPVFEVRDVAAAANHYSALGFTVSHHSDTYAFARRERDLTIHLEMVEHEPRPSVLYIHCGDADDVAAQWRLAGVTVEGPSDMPWGMREGRHVDPDGHVLRFGSPLDEHA